MDKNKPQHVLIIRLSAMGDVAMLVPVLSKLSETYPQLKITLLTKAQFVAIFKSFSHVLIIEADVKNKHKGLLGLYKLYKEIKPLGITKVADVHNVLRSSVLKFFFKSEGIPVVQINKGRKEKKALTRTTNKDFKQLKTSQQRYADVFKKLGYAINLTEVKLLEKEVLTDNIKTITGPKKTKWIGIAPFAAHEGKTYPLELMKEVISKITKKENYKILLFGGGIKEEKILNGIETRFDNVISVVGKFSFSEELSLISNLDLMLSMDSGNGHLAANYGIPVVTLWGVTHPFAGFAPFGQPKEHMILSDSDKYPLIPTSIYGNKVPEGYEMVMETISPELIYNRIINLL